MFLAWLDFWKAFWTRPEPPCAEKTCPPKACNLDELSEALRVYLDSAREVAIGAAKNVEDAERLLHSLEAIKERKRADLSRNLQA